MHKNLKRSLNTIEKTVPQLIQQIVVYMLITVILLPSLIILIPSMSIQGYAAEYNYSADGFISWLDSMKGKTVDADGVYDGQCVDIVVALCDYLGVKRTSGNGKDYATNSLPSGWTRIKGGTPQKGDILVYTNAPNGHVAIYESKNNIWHTRYNSKGYVQKTTTFDYTGISNYWGLIRPDYKGQSGNKFSSSYCKDVTDDEAIIHAIMGETRFVTEAGFTIMDISLTSPSIVKKTEQFNCQVKSGTDIYYSMNKWYGKLKSNHTYLCTIYINICGNDYVSDSITIKTTGNGNILPSGVSLNKSATTIKKGSTETLTATVSPSNATNKAVTWSSSNTSVASVNSSGKVTALAAGEATIKATTVEGSKSASCKVTVIVPITGVSLNKSSTTIEKGKTETLAVTVSPGDASNKKVTWSSDNTSVATVDKNGKVTAVGGGTANITVKTADGGKTASCKVTVNVPVTGIKLNKSSTTIEKGKTETLTATVSPSDASNKNVSWSSDNTDVATVNSSGKVTAKADGSANITVKTADGGKTASCKVTVKTTPSGVSLNKSETTIDIGNTETLKATVKPDDATNKKVTWSSDNEAVATVDSKGKVTAVKKGTANITVTTNDGGKTATCKVTVNVPVTGVAINTPDTTSIKKGTTLNLSATVSPSDASNTKVTWSSGEESVATVDANGKVTGVAPGTATITVTTNDGLKTDSIDIEVYWYGNINIDYLWDGQENTAIELDASGRVVSAPITPDRIGYILEGWYKEKTFASKVDFAKDVLAKDSTVYAKWAPITYTVKYDPNCNGSGKMTDLKCSYDQKYTLAANAYTNPHNIFIGWNTQADGKGKVFDNKASIENLTTKDGDVITLYAQWESTYCTVTFDYLDGVHSAVTQKVDRGGLVIAPEVFDRADYVFDGWYSDSSFKTPFNPATGTIEGDTTLYAHWIPSSDDYGDLSEEEIEEIIEGGKTGDDIPNNLWISGVTDKQYTGKEITQSFKVYDHKTLLKSGKDYTVKYTNNKKVGTATITIKGKGNYSGTVTETFQILPADISDTTNSVVFDKTMFKAYTGGVQNPVPSLTVNGKKLTNKKDYIVTYPSSGEDAYVAPGLYVVRLTGTGNYTGYVDIAMTIGDQGRVSVSKLTIGSISAQTYTGSELTPAVSVKNGKKKLTENVDYEVSYSNNINVGTATVKITGKGNYFGEKTATFKIKGTAIADAVRVSLSQSTFTYDKSEHIPGVTVMAKKTGATLIQGVDYEVSYSNTVNAGKATVTITGKGSYSGTVKKTYTIAAYNISSDPDSLMTLKVTDNVTMMKGGAKPGVKLTYDGTDLVEGKDYKLTYSNNTSVGGKNKPAVTIKGCGNFAGTITKNYVIEQQSIYSLSISVKDVQYSPKAGKYKSVPTITDLNGKTLKSGTDYNNVKYTYENETILPDGTTRLAGDTVGSKDILPVGTVVRVSATGKGSYAGTISTTYRIVKCSIANAKITVKNQEYTGKAVIPDKEDIVVKVNGVTLSSDEFEIISCSNNVNKGSKAKLTIRGLNAYGGVKSRTFTIKSKVFKWWWE